MARRRKVLWIGVALIAVYWLSPWWLPRVVEGVGLDPRGDGLQEKSATVRLLEVYHWPHLAAMRWLGPRLQPSDSFYPPGWVLVLTQLIPMFVMTAVWWGAVHFLGKKSPAKWAGST